VPLGELWTLLECHEGVPRAEAEPLLVPIIEAGYRIDNKVMPDGLPAGLMRPPKDQRPLVRLKDGRWRLTEDGWDEVDWDTGTIAGAKIMVRWPDAVAWLQSVREDRERRKASAPIADGPAAATAAPAEQTAPLSARNSGGRPEKYDWLAFDAEVVRIANTPDGLPPREDLQNTMLQWCEDNWGKQPGDSMVRERIARLYPAGN
jgi:hypothetical protein